MTRFVSGVCLSRVNQLRVMMHRSRWIQAGGPDVADLTFEPVDKYLAQGQAAGTVSFVCSRLSPDARAEGRRAD